MNTNSPSEGDIATADLSHYRRGVTELLQDCEGTVGDLKYLLHDGEPDREWFEGIVRMLQTSARHLGHKSQSVARRMAECGTEIVSEEGDLLDIATCVRRSGHDGQCDTSPSPTAKATAQARTLAANAEDVSRLLGGASFQIDHGLPKQLAGAVDDVKKARVAMQELATGATALAQKLRGIEQCVTLDASVAQPRPEPALQLGR